MFLSIISIVGLVLYFVTSSDSGSLVIDCISANGHPDPPIIQRVFWACTEGATATGLLVGGGPSGLRALQVIWFNGLISNTMNTGGTNFYFKIYHLHILK